MQAQEASEQVKHIKVRCDCCKISMLDLSKTSLVTKLGACLSLIIPVSFCFSYSLFKESLNAIYLGRISGSFPVACNTTVITL